jgi:hypothetical protein
VLRIGRGRFDRKDRAVAIGDNQIEGIEGGISDRLGIGTGEQVGDERPPRHAIRIRTAIAAQVGYDREPSLFGNARPGSARLEVAAGDEAITFGPARERRRWPVLRLITIARHNEMPAWMRLPGESENAHACAIAHS